MAEIIMTFALGFLIASGIGLTMAMPMWRRAENVTEKRLRASSPVSLDDFNADKDRMRAEFAMSARKLEMSVENLRKKAETRLAELDKREREVLALKEQIEEKSSLAAKRGDEIAILTQRLAEAETNLERGNAEIGKLREQLGEAQAVLARQAVAIREANSLVEGHKDEIDVLSKSVDEKTDELVKKAATIEERDAQLAKCGSAVAEQKMIVGELKRERAKYAEQVVQLEQQRDASISDAAESAERETAVTDERDNALAELAATKTEIAALKAKTGDMTREYAERAEWERRESALLRERLGDLAIEVERASSDIDSMLGGGLDAAQNSGHGENVSDQPPLLANSTNAEAGPRSLAQRIRALGGASAH